MDKRPNLPGSLAGAEQVVLDLVANGRKSVSVDKSKVGEEHGHENGAPDKLVNGHLDCDVLGLRSLNLSVKEVVKVVARRSMVQETKGRKSDESLPVEWTSADKYLMVGRSKIQEAHASGQNTRYPESMRWIVKILPGPGNLRVPIRRGR
mmetsp:Transcript_18724/g.43486  ORF Transcript_18724/g.43486 Transcript_18724/m.43486 type:complete len:150 (-) Transcript_18724:297-746(-)